MRTSAACVFLWMVLSLLCFSVSAGSVQDEVKSLQAIHVEDMDPVVPTAARPLLTSIKHDLRNEITDILNRNPRSMDQLENDDRLTTYLHTELHKRGIRFSDADDSDETPYGSVVDATLARAEKHPDLLIATTTIGIMCGGDDSLYVYRQNGARWDLILASEQNDYEKISSAQFGLQYAVSPPDKNNEFFLAFVHTTAWCTSNWQGLQYKAIKPTSDPNSPEVLYSGADGAYLGVDDPYKISATADTFTLQYVNSSLDSGLLTRPYMMKFKVEPNGVKRIAPIAMRAQDFLEEWLKAPWSQASAWTSPAAPSDIQSWHELLNKSLENLFVTYEFVQKCGAANRWQIGLDFEVDSDAKVQQKVPETLFFTIGKEEDFYLLSVDRKRPQGCPGKEPAQDWPESEE